MTSIQAIEKDLQGEGKTIDFTIGDKVKVHYRIIEGSKSRVQAFEGTVIGVNNGGIRSTFTVRKVSHGVGVERVFPLYAGTVESVEVKSRHRARRAKLYYLRTLHGKAARLREERE